MTRNKENKKRRIRRKHFYQGLCAASLVFLIFFFIGAPNDVVSKEEMSVQHAAIEAAAQEAKVPIFVYHSVRPYIKGESKYQDVYDTTPELLREQLQYLKDKGYSTITFNDLEFALLQNKPLPPKPVILSFDDGWENEYLYALPLLKEFGAVGTFYIYTNVIGHTHYMTWDEVLAIQNAGMEIGGHSKSHPILTTIADDAALRDEIEGGKKILEEHLGQAVNTFAYPFGAWNDRVEAFVKEAGYRSARTLTQEVLQKQNEMLRINAFLSSDSLRDFVRVLDKAKE